MKRRSFLKSSSFVSLPMFLNGLPLAAAGKTAFFNTFDNDDDKVLVLIQMNGGNDGLQTIIPLDHFDLLSNVRSNIVLPFDSILTIEDTMGFHPSMTGMRSLYDNAKMAVIQDVGYPNQNRSHFRSTDIWTTGSPSDEIWTNGWMGRYFENRFPEYPIGYPNADYPDPFALSIGSIVSETCQGTISNFSLALTDPLSITELSSGGSADVPDSNYGRELQFLRTSIEQANAYGGIITEAAEKGTNMSTLYDDEINLHRQLKSIALLISGGLKTRIYVANIGGFDTHANQVDPDDPASGDHATLLQYLSDAVNAFQDDLSQLGLEERVLTMTFSEFGRRIRSNDSLGTDHGTAAPMMLFGSCVEAGMLGSSPALPDNPTQSDGVPMQFDFRNIYGTILTDWFKVEEEEVKSLLFNEFSRLSFLKSCDSTTPTDDPVYPEDIEVTAFPNPFRNTANIRFSSKGEFTRISVYDSIGSEIALLSNRTYPEGYHTIQYDGTHLTPGNYFLRFSSTTGRKTLAVVKI